MVIRILFSALLITSCSLQAMKRDVSEIASSEGQSLGSFLANAKKAHSGQYAHGLHNFFLLEDDKSSKLKKNISSFMYKLTCIMDEGIPIAFNSDGTRLVSHGIGGQKAHIINMKTGETEYDIGYPKKRKIVIDDETTVTDYMSPVAFNDDGTQLAVTTYDTLCIIDIQTGNVVHKIPSPHWVASVALTRNFTHVAMANHEKDICIIDVQTGVTKKIVIPSDECHFVSSVVFNRDGTHLIAQCSSWDEDTIGYFYLIDVQTDTVECESTYPDSFPLVFNPNLTHLVGYDYSHCVIYSMDQDDVIQPIMNHQDGDSVKSIAFSRDGRLLAIGLACNDGSGKAFVIDVATNAIQHVFDHSKWVAWVLLNPDGTMLVTKSNPGETRTFAIKTNQLLMNQLSLNESVLLKAFEQATVDTRELPDDQLACIHANPEQWATWESLRTKLNGGDDKPDCLAVQRLTRYIMKKQTPRRSERLKGKANRVEIPEKSNEHYK